MPKQTKKSGLAKSSFGRPNIILDFDRVLFDTNSAYFGLHDAVRPFGVTSDVWQATLTALRQSGEVFQPRVLAAMLAKRTNRPAQLIEQALEEENAEASWYVYADAKPFLEHFAQSSALHLLTYGDQGYQSRKLAACGLNHYFASMHIVSTPKAEYDQLPINSVQRAIFINDDLSEMLDLARRYRWASHIQIARANVDVATDSRIPAFATLPEASNLITRLLNTEAVGEQPDAVANDGGQRSQSEKLYGALGQ